MLCLISKRRSDSQNVHCVVCWQTHFDMALSRCGYSVRTAFRTNNFSMLPLIAFGQSELALFIELVSHNFVGFGQGCGPVKTGASANAISCTFVWFMCSDAMCMIAPDIVGSCIVHISIRNACLDGHKCARSAALTSNFNAFADISRFPRSNFLGNHRIYRPLN